MFCDQCGATLSPGAQFCGSCGKAVAPGSTRPVAPPAGAQSSARRVQRHVNLLATLWLANGILRAARLSSLLLVGHVLPLLAGWGFGPGLRGWPFSFLPFGIYTLAVIQVVFGIAHIVLAWGLFQRQPWARTLGIIVGVIALLRIPFGTALGIYTLWVLAPEDSAREYDQLSSAYQQAHQASA
jgi:zinc-ribbon domain